MARTTTSPPVTHLAERLGLASVRLARLLRQQAEGNMSPTMRAALGTISREGLVTLGALAAIEQVAPPTVTKVVGKLEDAGLVVRQVDADDRRICRVALSENGQRWMDDDRRRRRAWLAERVRRLDDRDVKTLTDAV